MGDLVLDGSAKRRVRFDFVRLVRCGPARSASSCFVWHTNVTQVDKMPRRGDVEITPALYRRLKMTRSRRIYRQS
jgi:hypothetical protein